jgi:F-type H+-transporting ATPase subunit delta
MAETVRHSTVFDAGQQRLAAVYAKALLSAAADADIEEQVLAELDAFVQLLGQLPQLAASLHAPRVPLDRKFEMLDKALRGQVSATLRNFLKVLCRRRRFDCIDAVHRAAHKQFNDLTGRIAVQVTTASPLDEPLLARMIQRLEAALGKRVVLETRIDGNLIGGLVVRVGDTRYDASLASQLMQLRDSAVEGTTRAIRQDQMRFGGETPGAVDNEGAGEA